MNQYVSIVKRFKERINLKVGSKEVNKLKVAKKDIHFFDSDEIERFCEYETIPPLSNQDEEETWFWESIFFNSETYQNLKFYDENFWTKERNESTQERYTLKKGNSYFSYGRIERNITLQRTKEIWNYYKKEKINLKSKIQTNIRDYLELNDKEVEGKKQVYSDYINYTIQSICNNYKDINDIFEWRLMESSDNLVHSYSPYLKGKLNINSKSTLLKDYIDEGVFKFYKEVWSKSNHEKESLENLIVFKKLLVYCFDIKRINDSNNSMLEEKLRRDDNERFWYENFSDLKRDNIFNNPFYNNKLDLDQQDPEFWDSLE